MAEEKYEFQHLTQQQQDEMLSNTMKGWESDLFQFQTALQRYRVLEKTMEDGPEKDHIVNEIPVLESRIKSVLAYIASAKETGQVK